jgi:hypothetical protein
VANTIGIAAIAGSQALVPHDERDPLNAQWSWCLPGRIDYRRS